MCSTLLDFSQGIDKKLVPINPDNYTSLCKDKVNGINFIEQNDDCQGL